MNADERVQAAARAMRDRAELGDPASWEELAVAALTAAYPETPQMPRSEGEAA